jgi:fluoride ion exporter CrcB/FEX
MTLFLSALLVMIGAGVGGAGRYLAALGWSRLLEAHPPRHLLIELVPWPTLVLNIVSCFGLGIAVSELGAATEGVSLFAFRLLSLGVLAGLSALAVISQEIVDLIRKGMPVIAAGYFMVIVGAGMAALWLGLAVVQ